MQIAQPQKNDQRSFKYYDLVMVAFVTILLCSNLIGAAKVCNFFGFNFTAGILFFPLSYIFGDILTEVYGYARSRKVVWAGFGAMIFASLMSFFVIQMPAADFWQNQQALEAVMGFTWRITAASLIAYFVGEFANSYVLAKLKVLMQGKALWVRTIGSTIIGEAFDSVLFYPLAFLGTWPTDMVFQVMIGNYVAKVLVEIVFTPVTYKIVGFLKKAEQEDHYDKNTDFNPFTLKV